VLVPGLLSLSGLTLGAAAAVFASEPPPPHPPSKNAVIKAAVRTCPRAIFLPCHRLLPAAKIRNDLWSGNSKNALLTNVERTIVQNHGNNEKLQIG
jgi:hypothetical protein